MTDLENLHARNDKIRYEAEMINYKPPRYAEHGMINKAEKLRNIIWHDPLAPKKPKGAYVFTHPRSKKTHPELQFSNALEIPVAG